MITSSIFNEMSHTAHIGSKGCVCMLVAKLCLTLCDLMGPARLLCPWDSPGKNTGVGCHCLLHQPIFLSLCSCSKPASIHYLLLNTDWSLTYCLFCSGHSFCLACSCPCSTSFFVPQTYFSPVNPSWSFPRRHSLLPLISFPYISPVAPLFSFCLELWLLMYLCILREIVNPWRARATFSISL